MKLSKYHVKVNEYVGTKYEVYEDMTQNAETKYFLYDCEEHEIIAKANKLEKFDKKVYGV